MRALLAEVAGRRFALPLDLVRKVLPALAVTPIPNAPRAVLGVVQIREELHAVVSVERALGLGEGTIAARHHFVLVKFGRLLVALHVDRALDVVELAEEEFVPLANLVPGSAPAGNVAREGDGLVLVHDLPSFLSLQEIATMEKTLDEESGRLVA